jgi:transcription-repair coupling factor (superfamily II helicase)
MYDVITKHIESQSGFDTLCKNNHISHSIFGVADSMKPFFLACLNKRLKVPIIFVCKNSKDAKTYYEQGYVDNSSYFPVKDMEFQRFDAKSREDENERVSTLKNLINSKASVVFTSYDGLLSKLSPEKLFSSKIFTIKKGKNYDIADLHKKCVSLGYMTESLVEGEGSIAKRGSILDIYIPSEYAYRIDFFGDEVESIKAFDPVSQRTLESEFDMITVSCATEFILDERYLDGAVKTLNKEMAENHDAGLAYEIDLIKQGKNFDGIDKYLFAFYKGSTIFDYAKKCMVVFDQFEMAKQEAQAFLDEFTHDFLEFSRDGKALKSQAENLFSIEYIYEKAQAVGCFEFSTIKTSPAFSKAKQLDFPFKTPNSYRGNLEYLSIDVKARVKQDHHVYLYTGEQKNTRIVSKFLKARGIQSDRIHILSDPLIEGVEFSADRCIVLGERNIFGFSKKKKQAQQDNPLEFFTDLTEGDIVVHELHGRGKYLGLKTMEVQGKRRDYIHLEYKGGDKLYIPTEQIDRVQKYIGGEVASLSKLGGRDWDASKAKVSKAVKKLAFDLVNIYSHRTLNKGFVFSPDSGWQEEFEANFPYRETDGQVKCIGEIKSDMESKKVMDRLLLGDVGFGKTEVAMRACFKAVFDQKQVAVLAPTTLLSRQHHENFTERFEGFPVKVAQLSRFVTETNKKKTLRKLEEGNVDILIGTHAILSDRVKFADLGLLIIDEEQRFGVGHKEKIKNLKKNVDVLTLSATPIPRTLEMSLIGVRDMSMLKTPPIQRKKIKTYVLEYSKAILSRAVTREIERGGQCYVVCRRINQIDYLLNELKISAPDAKVTYIHGRLGEREIETKMTDFCNNQYDVLVATTIIESGLDIPNCNTLVVYEADKYGLSQLYQIKGRIGRGDKKAVCYLTYLKGDYISSDARKRLDAINQNTEFGAGFKIAMKDLEIRGAGNLLGPEQSGHMDKVGYDMYCKLMKKAVSEAKGEMVRELPECSVELKVDAYIPPTYIDDEVVKIEAYKMISAVKNTGQAKEVQDELKDRFGPIPLPVKNLITTSLIKAFAELSGLALVSRIEEGFKLKYAVETRVNFNKLIITLDEYKRDVKLNATTPPTLVFTPKRSAIKELFTFLNKISRCII